MKKLLLSFSVFAALLSLLLLGGFVARWWEREANAQAQTAKVKEPDEIGAVFALDEQGNLRPLEGIRGLFAAKGLFSRRVELGVPGLRSPVRFKRSQKLELIVRTMTPMETPVFHKVGNATNLANPFVLTMKDPTEYELFVFNSNEKLQRREVIFAEFGMVNTRGSIGYLNYVTRYGECSFKLTPVENLPPGEYAIKYGLDPFDCKEMYCFGID
jgi:hypothetical protein